MPFHSSQHALCGSHNRSPGRAAHLLTLQGLHFTIRTTSASHSPLPSYPATFLWQPAPQWQGIFLLLGHPPLVPISQGGWLRPEAVQDHPGDSSPTRLSVTSPSLVPSGIPDHLQLHPCKQKPFLWWLPIQNAPWLGTCCTNSLLHLGGELAVPAAWWPPRVSTSPPQPCSPLFKVGKHDKLGFFFF